MFNDFLYVFVIPVFFFDDPVQTHTHTHIYIDNVYDYEGMYKLHVCIYVMYVIMYVFMHDACMIVCTCVHLHAYVCNMQ
jgi:hypothetical protein